MPVDVEVLATRLARVEQQLSSSNTVASFEGGNFGYLMVDATYKARCRFLIPTRTMSVNKALLHFSLQPFRSGAASGTSGGTSGLTSANHTHSFSYSTGTESGTGTALDVHDLDVSQWLSAKGWHEVQISSTSLGGIFPSLAIFAVVGV
jgi:hypothetical protein